MYIQRKISEGKGLYSSGSVQSYSSGLVWGGLMREWIVRAYKLYTLKDIRFSQHLGSVNQVSSQIVCQSEDLFFVTLSTLSDMDRYRDLMFSFAFYGSTGLGIIGEVQVKEIEMRGKKNSV